jgi:NAD(P)-dependent dehydrogenase (short-subunit alcohol dehydrogenase family)
MPASTRTAVITGANSGFGRLTAETLHADGWNVFAAMRNVETRNAGAAAELRAKGIKVVELDVTSDASVDAAARTVFDQAGAVDLLVNNAGTAHFGILEAHTPASVEAQYAVNVVGPLRVNRAFLPAMRAAKQGLVIFVSSVVGRITLPFGGLYASSKWALEALAETSSYELAQFNIDVAIVQPGAFATEIFGKIITSDDTARVTEYGAFAQAANDRMSAAMGGSASHEPQLVADAILALANAPAGRRAFRTLVPDNEGVAAINAAVAPIQRGAMIGFDLEDMLPRVLV